MKLWRQWVHNRKIACGYVSICACLHPSGYPGSCCACGGAIPTQKEIDLELTLVALASEKNEMV